MKSLKQNRHIKKTLSFVAIALFFSNSDIFSMKRNRETFEQASNNQEKKRKVQDIFGYPKQTVPNSIETNQFIVSAEEEKIREQEEERLFLGKTIRSYEKTMYLIEIILQNTFKFLPLPSIKKLRCTNKYICMLIDTELKNNMKFIIFGKPNKLPTKNHNRSFSISIPNNEKWETEKLNHLINFIDNITLKIEGIYIKARKIDDEFLAIILRIYTDPEEGKCKKLKTVYFQFKKEFSGADEETKKQLRSLSAFFDNDIAPVLNYILIDADFGNERDDYESEIQSYATNEIKPFITSLPEKENRSIKKISLISATPDSSFLKYAIKYLKNLKSISLKNCDIKNIQNETFEEEINEVSSLEKFKITQITHDYCNNEFHKFFSVKSLEQFLTKCPRMKDINIHTIILGHSEQDFDNFLSLIKNISNKINHIEFRPNITDALRQPINANSPFFRKKLKNLKKDLESDNFGVSIELGTKKIDNDSDDDSNNNNRKYRLTADDVLGGGLDISIHKK